MTTANDIKFGIEVETHIAADDPTAPGRYYGPGAQVEFLPAGWKAKCDASIRVPHHRRKGCEFISPVLMGEAGLAEVHESVTKIKDRGAQVNASCGVHVTVTFPSDNAAALARLIALVAHFEAGIFATSGTKSRENGSWCKGLSRYGEGHKSGKSKAKAAEKKAKEDRYHALNLTHLAAGRDRVEFRLFSGSVNADKIVAWVRFILAIVEYSLTTDRAVSFEDRTEQRGDAWWNRVGGNGSRSLMMLLCKLGWLKTRKWGYRGKTYGEVTPAGLPTLAESTKTLRRLAKKYDGETR